MLKKIVLGSEIKKGKTHTFGNDELEEPCKHYTTHKTEDTFLLLRYSKIFNIKRRLHFFNHFEKEEIK